MTGTTLPGWTDSLAQPEVDRPSPFRAGRPWFRRGQWRPDDADNGVVIGVAVGSVHALVGVRFAVIVVPP